MTPLIALRKAACLKRVAALQYAIHDFAQLAKNIRGDKSPVSADDTAEVSALFLAEVGVDVVPAHFLRPATEPVVGYAEPNTDTDGAAAEPHRGPDPEPSAEELANAPNIPASVINDWVARLGAEIEAALPGATVHVVALNSNGEPIESF